MKKIAAVAVLLFTGASALASAAETPSLKDLLASNVNKQDVTITINVDSKQKSEHRESAVQETLMAFLAAGKPARLLLRKEGVHTRLDNGALSATWADDLQGWRVETFESDAERWSDFAKMNMHIFWVVPDPANVSYFDDNFRITSVEERAGAAVAKFKLRETPADAYWRRNKEKRGLTVDGALTIKADARVVSDAKVAMQVSGHSREFVVRASHEAGPIPAATFKMPPEIAKKVEERLKQE